MGNFTNTYQDVRNLTCRPRDNLTFRRELERQCHMQMLILYNTSQNCSTVSNSCSAGGDTDLEMISVKNWG